VRAITVLDAGIGLRRTQELWNDKRANAPDSATLLALAGVARADKMPRIPTMEDLATVWVGGSLCRGGLQTRREGPIQASPSAAGSSHTIVHTWLAADQFSQLRQYDPRQPLFLLSPRLAQPGPEIRTVGRLLQARERIALRTHLVAYLLAFHI
jgi:hypothetical protein